MSDQNQTTIIGYEDDGQPIINCPVCEGYCFVEIDQRGIPEAILCPECNGNGDIPLPSVH